MRVINRLVAALVVVATTLIAGCEKPAPQPAVEQIPVTYSALDGCWQMTMWQGAPLAEGTFVYIDFDRATHTYVMWDNINSMYMVDSTGSFAIATEEDGRYTLSGTYDYGKGDWSNDYSVTLSDGGNTMQWRAASTTMDFVRIEALPEFN